GTTDGTDGTDGTTGTGAAGGAPRRASVAGKDPEHRKDRVDREDPKGREELRAALRSAVAGEVDFGTTARALTTMDASNYRRVPLGVVAPRDADDVAAALEVCREHGVPVVARGGGTSIAGQATGTGVVLDFTRHMNRLLALDPRARTAVVQPGLVLDRLQEAAAPHGLRFGPDPSTHGRCTLGGMIGNNSCGSHSVAWGTTADNVRELSVVTARGDRLDPGRDWAGPAVPSGAVPGRTGPAPHRFPLPAPPHLRLRPGRPAARERRPRRPLVLRFRGHARHPHGGGGGPRPVAARPRPRRPRVRRRE